MLNAWSIEIGTNADVQRILDQSAADGSVELDPLMLWQTFNARLDAIKRAQLILARAIDGIDQPRP